MVFTRQQRVKLVEAADPPRLNFKVVVKSRSAKWEGGFLGTLPSGDVLVLRVNTGGEKKEPSKFPRFDPQPSGATLTDLSKVGDGWRVVQVRAIQAKVLRSAWHWPGSKKIARSAAHNLRQKFADIQRR